MNRTVVGVAGAVYGMILKHQTDPPQSRYVGATDPLQVFNRRVTNSISTPTFTHVYTFMYSLFRKAQIEPECMIASVVYLERMLEVSAMAFTPQNWERLVFTCIMVASKSWDDVSCSSHSFSLCSGGSFTLKELNRMERYLLRKLDYSLYVTSQTYREVYYELKEVWSRVKLDGLSENPVPLAEHEARGLRVRAAWGIPYIFGCAVEKTHLRHGPSGAGIGALTSPYPAVPTRTAQPVVRQTQQVASMRSL